MTQKDAELNVSIFFCQRIDKNQDKNRRMLERELGPKIKFFPLPCSGRIDPLHLVRAIEAGADKVYLLTCPEGTCRYREGNIRAKKRVVYAQGLIEEIGLERERLEIVGLGQQNNVTIDGLARELLARKATLGHSPVKTEISSCYSGQCCAAG